MKRRLRLNNLISAGSAKDIAGGVGRAVNLRIQTSQNFTDFTEQENTLEAPERTEEEV